MIERIVRRLPAVTFVLVAGASVAAGLAQSRQAPQAPLPILFVHGAGDSAALWQTTIWRFESNGYDPARLFAIDMTHPAPARDNSTPEENRSTTVDQASELSAMVTRILLSTGRKRLVLIGSSRGGYAIRNYIKNAGGAANVEAAILCGTPNHGVTAQPDTPDGEFNGLGRFLTQLNAGGEVQPGVRFLTLRSDTNDKYAQPLRGTEPTGVTYASPELRGATNIVLPGLDHREVAFHPRAFREMFRFINETEPSTLDIAPEDRPVLNGLVSGYVNAAATNLPLAGATVDVFEVDRETGQRLGGAVHTRAIGADGLWGPFTARPGAHYEFVVSAMGGRTVHVYRTPFPRSSRYVHLRMRPADPADAGSGSVVVLLRSRGYLGVGRDTFSIDGQVPATVPKGVATAESTKLRFPAGPPRPVRVVLNQESLTVLTWPFTEGHLVIAEFHY